MRAAWACPGAPRWCPGPRAASRAWGSRSTSRSGSLRARRGGGVAVVGLHQVLERAGGALRAELAVRSFARKSELRTSSPPPLPKIEPMNALTAIASLTVQGRIDSGTPCGHARRVVLEVLEDLAALGAVGVDELLLLRVTSASDCALGTNVGAVRHERERVHARDVGHRRAGGPAAEQHQEPAVLAGHEPDAVPEVGARLGVDVRHAELVAQDPQVRAARASGPRSWRRWA